MHHPQPQHLLKAIKIPIPVQQFVDSPQTKSGNQTINRLVNGVAALPQIPIVLRGGNGQFVPACLKNLEVQQVSSNPRESPLLPNPLQHLTKDQISQPEPLPLQLPIQPL